MYENTLTGVNTLQEPFVVYCAGASLRPALTKIVRLMKSGKEITDDFIWLTRSGNDKTLIYEIIHIMYCVIIGKFDVT